MTEPRFAEYARKFPNISRGQAKPQEQTSNLPSDLESHGH